MQDLIQKAHEIIAKSRSITVITGAGVSAESGIATYRDADGLWNQYRAQDFSSVDTFYKDPKRVWDWYKERRRVMAAAEPNAAHKALAELEQKSMQFMVLTQNIDGLHQRAGTDNIVELHGSVWRLRCTNCLNEWENKAELPDGIPQCWSCHSLARPAVVWFNESLKPSEWERAMRASYCDTLLVVGTSALVNPVASLPDIAFKNQARIIEINLEKTPISDLATVSIQAKAGEVLPEIVKDGDVNIGGTHELDLGKAMQRGLDKFYAKYPQLRKFVDGSGGKVE
jgi:NAD-dependent deacetylase